MIPLPLPAQDGSVPGFWEGLTRYDSSAAVQRYFCSTCGANVIVVEEDEWEFASGMLRFSAEDGGDVYEVLKGGVLDRAMLFVQDTKDAGAAVWLNGGKAEGLWGRKLVHRDSRDVTDEMMVAMEEEAKTVLLQGRGELLRGKCHCGDVKLEVLPPDERKEEKYAAGLCACKSCTKTSGYEITTWFTVPKEKVRIQNGWGLEEPIKEMVVYRSSNEAERRFCRRCGATISFTPSGKDNHDLPAGLFDAPEGSRAEYWLEWNKDGEDVGYREDAVDKAFVERLAEGVQLRTRQGADQS